MGAEFAPGRGGGAFGLILVVETVGREEARGRGGGGMGGEVVVGGAGPVRVVVVVVVAVGGGGGRRGGVGGVVDEGHEDGVVHEVDDALDRRFQLLGRRRRGVVGEREQVVPHLARQVDFARGVGDDVGGDEAVPEAPHLVAFRDIGAQGHADVLGGHGVVLFLVPFGVFDEFEVLQAVVLREVGGEGGQRPGLGGGVGEDFAQGGYHGTVGADGVEAAG